ncbi:MAG: HAMP domain-containing sensor histidine kinase [Bacteroidota bacterium]|nr:HAMP domain-containing sensor histidine kinase [Bacteroidota bacterium]
MNKRIIEGLIVLMGVGIFGVIIVQIIWMNNALKIRNELFTRSVNEALTTSVGKLESQNNLMLARQMMRPSVSSPEKVIASSTQKQTQVSKKVPRKTITTQASSDSTINFDFTMPAIPNINFDSLFSHEFHTRIIIQDPNSGSLQIEESHPFAEHQERYKDFMNKMKDAEKQFRHNSKTLQLQSGRALKELRKMETEGRFDPQTLNKILQWEPGNQNIFMPFDLSVFEGDKTNTPNEIKSPKKHTSTIQRVTNNEVQLGKKFQRKAQEIQSQTNRVIMELQNMEVGRHVDPKEIQKVLRRELNNRDISLPFDFAISDGGKVNYLSNKADSQNIVKSPFSVQLFPNDIIPKSTRLLVFFPNQKNFILRSINWLLLVSLFFSIVVFITFFLSIYFIVKQKKISEMKADFINNMTHEFKTPIATIGVAADSILNEKVIGTPHMIKYFTDMIRKENRRMNDHVEKILTMARLERHDFEFHFQKVSIHELIEKVIASYELHITNRGGSIVTEFNATQPEGTTDPVHFVNMISNLIDNANKYSPDSPSIRISTRNTPTGIIISVEDKGIGMSKAVQQKIFEKFYRETSGNIHNVKGFGLGLSYVKAVIDANHGSINVVSEPGQGSCFDIFIPFMLNSKL